MAEEEQPKVTQILWFSLEVQKIKPTAFGYLQKEMCFNIRGDVQEIPHHHFEKSTEYFYKSIMLYIFT